MRFAYFYFMSGEKEQIRAVAASHASYWHGFHLPSYAGGPFADYSGGLIVFESTSRAEAQTLADNDPFVRERLVGERWLKEWLPQ